MIGGGGHMPSLSSRHARNVWATPSAIVWATLSAMVMVKTTARMVSGSDDYRG